MARRYLTIVNTVLVSYFCFSSHRRLNYAESVLAANANSTTAVQEK